MFVGGDVKTFQELYMINYYVATDDQEKLQRAGQIYNEIKNKYEVVLKNNKIIYQNKRNNFS